MRWLYIVVLLTFYISFSSAQTGLPPSCPDCKITAPDESRLCYPENEGKGQLCASYDFTYVIVELNNIVSAPRFYSYCIRVDEFAQLFIDGSYEYMAQHRNSTLKVWVGNSVSLERFFWPIRNETNLMEKTQDYYVTSYSVIISLTIGAIAPTTNANITSRPIVFDDSCDPSIEPAGACTLDGTAKCVRRVDCGVVDDPLRSPREKGIRIFVVWDGQDRNSNPMKSASLLPSKFRALSLSKYYTSVEKFALPRTN